MLQAPFSEIYCSPHIDWQHRPAHFDSLSRVRCAYERDALAFEPPCTFSKWEWGLRLDFHQIFGDAEVVHIHAQNGLLSWLFDRSMYGAHLNSLGLRADNAFGCLSNFLFQPSRLLHEQLPTDVMDTLATEVVIGIQIR